MMLAMMLAIDLGSCSDFSDSVHLRPVGSPILAVTGSAFPGGNLQDDAVPGQWIAEVCYEFSPLECLQRVVADSASR